MTEMSSLNPSIFETILPSRYLTITLPLPNHHHHLRLSVLDSPSASAASSSTAAMWVPPGRESDWTFSTFSGHLQLLLSSSQPPLSRLILISKLPSYPHHPINLTPLLSALTPKSNNAEIPEIPLLIYEDDVVTTSTLETCEGTRVGEMLVENVELDINGVREYRRRLRFKRTPNLVQTQMRIRPKNESRIENLDDVEFELDNGALVQPYLYPMVAGISVISRFLIEFRPKALCLGVGGGALVGFLRDRLGFEVVGVEEDEAVLRVAKRWFGLGGDESESIRLVVDDGIEYVKRLGEGLGEGSGFRVIMVDLDSSDVSLGVCAPPVEFVTKAVLRALRDVLCEVGVVVVNMIPSSELFYERLVCEFSEVFEELYEIDVGNGENFVLVATKSNVGNALEVDGGPFLTKLKSVVPSCYFDSIRKIS